MLLALVGTRRWARKAMMYQSTYVRYERRGDRVVPVRVTKSWVTSEVRSMDQRKEPKVLRQFAVTRVSELRRFPTPEAAPEPWVSSSRVETRARMLTLDHVVRGKRPDGTEFAIREPVLFEAGAGEPCLEMGPAFAPTAAQAGYTLENGNGWLTAERVAA